MSLARHTVAFCRALLAVGVVLGATAVSSSAWASPEVEQIFVTQARAMRLSRSIAWLRLLHDSPTSFGGLSSEVDGREFFLAPRGKEDPEAELEATLRALFRPVVPGQEDTHAACRFPARRLWLNERLQFEGLVPAPPCPALARYWKAIDPESATVVYSSNYLDNPASAFGHTFLRLKKRRPAGATEPSELLDFGIDYVATTDTNNPLLYAFEGLTGMFRGMFRFHSYDYKIREYGNYEARDLWEYDLALTQPEVTLLALHLWELANTHIDYFYLTGNCSYYVAAVLEAAAPRLDLLSEVKALVLPADTIKALFATPGLVQAVAYRPSLRSQLRARVARLSPAERSLVQRLLHDPRSPLPDDLTVVERFTVLDTAVFALDARFAKQLIVGQRSDVLAARHELVARRRLVSSATSPAPPPMTMPLDKAPERGHGSMRVSLGTGGTSQYGNSFGSLGFRLALHDLTDPPDGELELSQLQFLDTHVRYDLTRRSLSLDALTFAEVLALKPLSRFEQAASWRARAFGVRLHDRACPDCFAHGLDGGVGATIATPDEHAAVFLLADAYVAFSGSLDGVGGSFVRVGVGPYAGLRLRLPGNTVGLLSGTWSYLPAQTLQGTYDVRAVLRAAVGKDVALGVEAAMQPSSFEAQLTSYLYF